MLKRLVVALAIAGLVTALVTVASAQSPSDSITGQRDAGVSSSVLVTGEAAGVRLLVVDDTGTLIAIWSNTSSPEHRLAARLEHRNGTQLSLTEDILGQYQAVLDGVDWTQRGLVYSNPS